MRTSTTHPLGTKERVCGGEPRDIRAPLDTKLPAKVTLVTGTTIGFAKGDEQEAAEEAEGILARKTKEE